MTIVNPYNPNNAIKVVAFAFEFENDFGEKFVRNFIANNSEDLEKTLPRQELHKSLTIQVEQSTTSAQRINGVTFDRLKPNGLQEWAITIVDNKLIFRCSEYTRWNEIWGNVKEYINQFKSDFSDLKIKSIVLEYADEFSIISIENPDWKEELFNKKTKYLSSNLFEINGLWHSHHGFFNKNENTIHNVKVDLVKSKNQGFLIRMITNHSTVVSDEISSIDFINNTMESNHFMNKQIMNDMLSPEMLNRINLKI